MQHLWLHDDSNSKKGRLKGLLDNQEVLHALSVLLMPNPCRIDIIWNQSCKSHNNGYLHLRSISVTGGGTGGQGGYSPSNIYDEGEKSPPPHTHTCIKNFLGLMLKNDPVRTCKERAAKCEIKTNHFEKLNNNACCTKKC